MKTYFVESPIGIVVKESKSPVPTGEYNAGIQATAWLAAAGDHDLFKTVLEANNMVAEAVENGEQVIGGSK